MATDGTDLFITGYSTPYAANDWQIFVAKYDKQLKQHWIKTCGGNGSETARGIAACNGFFLLQG